MPRIPLRIFDFITEGICRKGIQLIFLIPAFVLVHEWQVPFPYLSDHQIRHEKHCVENAPQYKIGYDQYLSHRLICRNKVILVF